MNKANLCLEVGFLIQFLKTKTQVEWEKGLLDGLCFMFQMENTETRSEDANAIACVDLEKTLQKLENLSDDMAQLACVYLPESNHSEAVGQTKKDAFAALPLEKGP